MAQHSTYTTSENSYQTAKTKDSSVSCRCPYFTFSPVVRRNIADILWLAAGKCPTPGDQL